MATREKPTLRNVRKCAELSRIVLKQELKARANQVGRILKKPECSRSVEETLVLSQSPDIVQASIKRAKTRERAKQRKEETEDPPHILKEKSVQLAEAITKARRVVVYTGAGISTAASIPDYRGPNGVWTLLEKGIEPMAMDLSDAEPTYTHMAIATLYQHGYVKYVVSQNCDGLHLRSGLPRHCLSELHGNMYLEICNTCLPQREYLRLFDVTQRTGVRRHKTGRFCSHCKCELRDTIVHFGEKGSMLSPYNWEPAAHSADKADLVICLGSSLKVLKRYSCLWATHKPTSERPLLVIANLQWTPKDDAATLKINGKCDEVMKVVMDTLGLEAPSYQREMDPIFYLATTLKQKEIDTHGKKVLVPPDKCLWKPDDQYFAPKRKRKRQIELTAKGAFKSAKRDLASAHICRVARQKLKKAGHTNQHHKKKSKRKGRDDHKSTPPKSMLPNGYVSCPSSTMDDLHKHDMVGTLVKPEPEMEEVLTFDAYSNLTPVKKPKLEQESDEEMNNKVTQDVELTQGSDTDSASEPQEPLSQYETVRRLLNHIVGVPRADGISSPAVVSDGLPGIATSQAVRVVSGGKVIPQQVAQVSQGLSQNGEQVAADSSGEKKAMYQILLETLGLSGRSGSLPSSPASIASQLAASTVVTSNIRALPQLPASTPPQLIQGIKAEPVITSAASWHLSDTPPQGTPAAAAGTQPVHQQFPSVVSALKGSVKSTTSPVAIDHAYSRMTSAAETVLHSSSRRYTTTTRLTGILPGSGSMVKNVTQNLDLQLGSADIMSPVSNSQPSSILPSVHTIKTEMKTVVPEASVSTQPVQPGSVGALSTTVKISMPSVSYVAPLLRPTLLIPPTTESTAIKPLWPFTSAIPFPIQLALAQQMRLCPAPNTVLPGTRLPPPSSPSTQLSPGTQLPPPSVPGPQLPLSAPGMRPPPPVPGTQFTPPAPGMRPTSTSGPGTHLPPPSGPGTHLPPPSGPGIRLPPCPGPATRLPLPSVRVPTADAVPAHTRPPKPAVPAGPSNAELLAAGIPPVIRIPRPTLNPASLRPPGRTVVTSPAVFPTPGQVHAVPYTKSTVPVKSPAGQPPRATAAVATTQPVQSISGHRLPPSTALAARAAAPASAASLGARVIGQSIPRGRPPPYAGPLSTTPLRPPRPVTPPTQIVASHLHSVSPSGPVLHTPTGPPPMAGISPNGAVSQIPPGHSPRSSSATVSYTQPPAPPVAASSAGAQLVTVSVPATVSRPTLPNIASMLTPLSTSTLPPQQSALEMALDSLLALNPGPVNVSQPTELQPSLRAGAPVSTDNGPNSAARLPTPFSAYLAKVEAQNQQLTYSQPIGLQAPSTYVTRPSLTSNLVVSSAASMEASFPMLTTPASSPSASVTQSSHGMYVASTTSYVSTADAASLQSSPHHIGASSLGNSPTILSHLNNTQTLTPYFDSQPLTSIANTEGGSIQITKAKSQAPNLQPRNNVLLAENMVVHTNLPGTHALRRYLANKQTTDSNISNSQEADLAFAALTRTMSLQDVHMQQPPSPLTGLQPEYLQGATVPKLSNPALDSSVPNAENLVSQQPYSQGMSASLPNIQSLFSMKHSTVDASLYSGNLPPATDPVFSVTTPTALYNTGVSFLSPAPPPPVSDGHIGHLQPNHVHLASPVSSSISSMNTSNFSSCVITPSANVSVSPSRTPAAAVGMPLVSSTRATPAASLSQAATVSTSALTSSDNLSASAAVTMAAADGTATFDAVTSKATMLASAPGPGTNICRLTHASGMDNQVGAAVVSVSSMNGSDMLATRSAPLLAMKSPDDGQKDLPNTTLQDDQLSSGTQSSAITNNNHKRPPSVSESGAVPKSPADIKLIESSNNSSEQLRLSASKASQNECNLNITAEKVQREDVPSAATPKRAEITEPCGIVSTNSSVSSEAVSAVSCDSSSSVEQSTTASTALDMPSSQSAALDLTSNANVSHISPDSKTVEPSLGQRRANVGPAGLALAQRWADDTLLSGSGHVSPPTVSSINLPAASTQSLHAAAQQTGVPSSASAKNVTSHLSGKTATRAKHEPLKAASRAQVHVLPSRHIAYPPTRMTTRAKSKQSSNRPELPALKMPNHDTTNKVKNHVVPNTSNNIEVKATPVAEEQRTVTITTVESQDVNLATPETGLHEQHQAMSMDSVTPNTEPTTTTLDMGLSQVISNSSLADSAHQPETKMPVTAGSDPSVNSGLSALTNLGADDLQSETENVSSGTENTPSGTENTPSPGTENTPSPLSTTPGWFGKGLRKRLRKKRLK